MKKGDFVTDGKKIILVTGGGKEPFGDMAFSGVVVETLPLCDDGSEIGYYSRSWAHNSFSKSEVSIRVAINDGSSSVKRCKECLQIIQ